MKYSESTVVHLAGSDYSSRAEVDVGNGRVRLTGTFPGFPIKGENFQNVSIDLQGLRKRMTFVNCRVNVNSFNPMTSFVDVEFIGFADPGTEPMQTEDY